MDLIIIIMLLIVVGILFYEYEVPLYEKNLELLELKVEFYNFLLDNKCDFCSNYVDEDIWDD